tara:strand:+ start:612 stop:761 length:150 start_codon:yes stop_codon:yes gene_type:complete
LTLKQLLIHADEAGRLADYERRLAAIVTPDEQPPDVEQAGCSSLRCCGS